MSYLSSKVELTFGPQYDQISKDDDSTTSSSGSEASSDSSNESLSSQKSASEYDDEEEEKESPGENLKDSFYTHKWEQFCPRVGVNCCPLNGSAQTLVIALKQGQDIMISGSFQIRIVKGGITYNEVHYNASRELISIWHPTCSSMSPISSSFYAGWDERNFLNNDITKTGIKHQEFECILLVSSRCSGLSNISRLNHVFKSLWVPQDYLFQGASSANSSFAILSRETMKDTTNILTLNISKAWSSKLSELSLFHKNNLHDMRVMVLGGKNSGKSTFLRLLLQKFLHTDTEEDEAIFYLDIDPGQTEFSRPDSISLTKIQKDVELGNPLGQSNDTPLTERYIGTSSPGTFPSQYLQEVNNLMSSFTDEQHMGTTLLNVPGWIKGFGIQILNTVIRGFKPTHIVIIDSDSRKQVFLNEFQIGPTFITPQRESYEPEISRIDGYHGSSASLIQSRFHASHLRQFRLLSHFHKTHSSKLQIEYNFTPMVNYAPLRVSFGVGKSIKAFMIEQNVEGWSDKDIKDALEGTIVGIYTTNEDFIVEQPNRIPIVRKAEKSAFTSLGLIHSINVRDSFINIYLPLHVKNIQEAGKSYWFLRRCKTETPLCELYPIDGSLAKDSDIDLPFISFKRPKKYEFIWKVRRNILRRGHSPK
ncbi:LANO_0F09120g1_1 [Lachancea nothofagi CBS 11611]|uniref:Polynucleotide 5'-hydroxyl-kinase GRC3 n=1 Tax=Lachancea nothofagi CBS 11611 TaxID=1266666 RepID=A0A1G4K9R6_9SACH|nr:LANO_0F09120g1_1 [Lachancea nothofagi CBS 11611]